MHIRLKTLVVCAALVGASGLPAAVHADDVGQPDKATSLAIATWRANALALVPANFQEAVAASYRDETISTDLDWVRVRQVAEEAAFAQLDQNQRALIETYYSAGRESGTDE